MAGGATFCHAAPPRCHPALPNCRVACQRRNQQCWHYKRGRPIGVSLVASSETGTRTLVSAVRGRRPRPLDDITNYVSSETGTRTLVSAVRGRRPRPLDDITEMRVQKYIRFLTWANIWPDFFIFSLKNLFFVQKVPFFLPAWQFLSNLAEKFGPAIVGYIY